MLFALLGIIFGAIAIFTGKIRLTRKVALEGKQAEAVGIILLAPIVIGPLLTVVISNMTSFELISGLECWAMIGVSIYAAIVVALRRPGNNHKKPATQDEQERMILQWLAQGLSNVEIADRLGISAVQSSLIKTKLFDKFGVKSETELISEARRQGYLPAEASGTTPN